VLLLTLGSLLARGAYLGLGVGDSRALIGDEPGYHGIAADFLAGEGWHDGPFFATRPPLTSWLLTLLYFFAGPRIEAGRWAMVIVASLVAPVIFLTGMRLYGGGSRAPLWAGIAWTLYPPAVFYSASMVTENLAALLAVSSLGSYLWAASSRNRWGALLTGVLWAAGALNRPSFLLLPLAMLAIHLVKGRATVWRWSVPQWSLALVGLVVTLAPWTVRNLRVLGALVPVTSYGGIMFSSSNATLGHPVVQAGGYYHSPEIRGRLHELPENLWGSQGLRLGLEGISANPGLFAEALFHRAVNFWTPRPDPYDPAWTLNDWAMSLIWIPTLLLFALSFLRVPWRADWPLLTVVAYTFLVTLPFWGTPRFRFPVDSLIVLRAMLVVEATAAIASARRRGAAPRLASGEDD
jgi:4-amino-4-deoxy-L-arabinose transferase-like glycosyltransferase